MGINILIRLTTRQRLHWRKQTWCNWWGRGRRGRRGRGYFIHDIDAFVWLLGASSDSWPFRASESSRGGGGGLSHRLTRSPKQKQKQQKQKQNILIFFLKEQDQKLVKYQILNQELSELPKKLIYLLFQ